MLKIDVLKIDELETVAKLISEINKDEESHIGYCGTDHLEIMHSIKEAMNDITYNNCFVTAYEQEKLVGVLGFDADIANHSAEIWGPFIMGDNWNIVNNMWKKMTGLLPIETKTIHMFPNKKNKKTLQLAHDLSFKKRGNHTILSFNITKNDEIKADHYLEISQEFYTDMIELHDLMFPNAYYSGQQIIERINEDRKVFINVKNNQLHGYIYVETDPIYEEARIEFFAVKDNIRGKGIGSQLLGVALKWFISKGVDSITLCVDSSNQKAIHLYKKVGFKQIHELSFLSKTL